MFLIRGNAGFISSTVVQQSEVHLLGLRGLLLQGGGEVGRVFNSTLSYQNLLACRVPINFIFGSNIEPTKK